MKKALLIVTILFVSVFTTACINNLAVQELNNKAKEFIEAGDYPQAIERLKSSLDLDPNLFETHYNLAIAYTKAENYSEAMKEFDEVIKMRPNFADAYYSLAVCEENLAKDIQSGIVIVDENGSYVHLTAGQIEEKEETDLTEREKQDIQDLYSSAIDSYQTYLQKSPDAADVKDVQDKIEQIKILLEEK